VHSLRLLQTPCIAEIVDNGSGEGNATPKLLPAAVQTAGICNRNILFPRRVDLVRITPPCKRRRTPKVAQNQDEIGDRGGDESYAPDFDYFDRSLLGRQEPQPPQVNELKNNEKTDMEISPGKTAYFVFKRGKRSARANNDAPEALEARGVGNTSDDPAEGDLTHDTDELEADIDGAGYTLLKRQTNNRIWISATTCRQPTANGTAKPKAYPQLVMFISTSTKNQKPGPDVTDNTVTPPSGLLFDNGFASLNLSADNDIYVGISAPVLPKDLVGSWSFEVAASIDGSYHNYDGTNPFLYMVDNDSASALFITYDLTEPGDLNNTEEWTKNNPFKMYAFPSGSDAPITGMERSLCALKDFNKKTNVSVAVTITTKFGANLPRSQFHVQGLQPGKKYNGFLTVEGGKDVPDLPGNSTIRGGGMVFQQFEYTTKSGTYPPVLQSLRTSLIRQRRLLPSNLRPRLLQVRRLRRALELFLRRQRRQAARPLRQYYCRLLHKLLKLACAGRVRHRR
jgi:calcium channel MID1